MKNKSFVLFFLLFSFVFPLCAEKSVDFTLSFLPTLMLNTEQKEHGAPSPIVFPVSLGLVFPNKSFVSFQPRLSFFTNYLLWEEEKAYPAEIENRTATAFSFLFDFPLAFTFTPKEKHSLELSIGPSILARFAVLSNGVSSSEKGTSGTASDDVSNINSYFWEEARFLYARLGFSYLHTFSPIIKAGPEFLFYAPLGELFSGSGMQNALFSLGIKIRF